MLKKKLFLCQNVNCFSSKTFAGGGSTSQTAVESSTTRISERLNFFNDMYHQRRQIADVTSLPNNLNTAPRIINSGVPNIGGPINLNGFETRVSYYTGYYPRSVQNSGSSSAIQGIKERTLLLLRDVESNASEINNSAIIPYAQTTGSVLQVNPRIPIYHLDNSDPVAGLYSNALVLPVPRTTLVENEIETRQLQTLVCDYLNERSRFDEMLPIDSRRMAEPVLRRLNSIRDSVAAGGHNVNFASLFEYQKMCKNIKVLEEGDAFLGLAVVLNFFSLSTLDTIMETFNADFGTDVYYSSAFALFIMSFTGLWIVSIPMVDLGVMPMTFFRNRLRFHVETIRTRRRTQAASREIDLLFTGFFNNTVRSLRTAAQKIADLSANFSSRVEAQSQNNIFSSGRQIYQTIIDNGYYIVLAILGIAGVAGVLIFTSIGGKIVSFLIPFLPTFPSIKFPKFKSTPTETLLPPIESKDILDQSIVGSPTNSIAILGFWEKNFESFSNKISEYAIFAFNHLQ